MKDKSILIVDDNVNITKTMALIFEKNGYLVNTAQNGLEAVKKVKKKAYNVIFMDIKMPLMNGVEAFKKIKKINPNTSVMMMTAYAVENLVQEAIEEGAKGIIYKPFDIDDLVSIVRELEET